ncbi:MAG: hypothetical protein KGM98_02655, partial [Bacteroidota bacterium]|nr:hypothetical protein [Bacteroidota bacterium]
CIRYYDEMIEGNPTPSILHDLGLSLKAGALVRSGHRYEAALLFSREFSKTKIKRVSNYMSFTWCVGQMNDSDRTHCLQLCHTRKQKANLLGLFSLGSIVNEEPALRQIYRMDPSSEMLPILGVREINKIEENYLSPILSHQEGGSTLYFYWPDEEARNSHEKWLAEARSLTGFYDSIAQNPEIQNRALFEAGAAYLSYITHDYDKGKILLARVGQYHPTGKIRDQASLTALLIAINEHKEIDSSAEAALLPSVKWLRSSAILENKGQEVSPNGYDDWITPWHNYYRDLFSQVLAARYHAQNERYKELLCIGNGEAISSGNYQTEDFLENQMQTSDLIALYHLMRAPLKSPWDAYLCAHFPLSTNKVREVIAVSCTRDYDFDRAIQWMGRIHNKKIQSLSRNPFGDLLIDNQDSLFSFDRGSFSRVGFLKEMAWLKNKEKQGKAIADDLYKLGVGFYNMTYYGRAWEMVAYERSGADGYYIPKDALPYQREYYGCFTAEKYFEKAMNHFQDPGDKARCLFMMAKCAQKRGSARPDEFDGFDPKSKAYHDFKYSKYFPKLVQQYGHTSFFREAFNTCSYLRDFVKQQK